ncbi:MAG: hypothetical protein AB7G39_00040 [Alphaproteobacteria bacterium]
MSGRNATARKTFKPKQVHIHRHRKCLMCGDRFESEWAGERVCKRCKATSVWRQG